MESAQAANSACSLPPCGGGLGRGVVVVAPDVSTHHPHPQPLPTRGRGAPPSSRRRCASTSPERALIETRSSGALVDIDFYGMAAVGATAILIISCRDLAASAPG